MNPGPLTVLRNSGQSINCVAFTKQECLVSGTLDGIINVWGLISNRIQFSNKLHSGSILSINMMTDMVGSSSRDGTYKLLSIVTEKCISVINTGAFHFCNSDIDRSVQGMFF